MPARRSAPGRAVPQRQTPKRGATARGTTAADAARRRRGPHARKPGVGWRPRLRIPSAGRALALLLATLTVAAMLAAVNGPWLRVTEITYAGERLTSRDELAAKMRDASGAPLLGLRAGALERGLRQLPAVASARVDASLPNVLHVEVTEKSAAFVWQAGPVRWVGASDGTIIGRGGASAEPLPAALGGLPFIDDRRGSAAEMGVGSRVDSAMLDTALKLVSLDPARLGSESRHLTLQLDDQMGFILVSAAPTWSAAFGFYTDAAPGDVAARVAAAGQIERQVAAIRTLFATRPEQTVSWVDARNPGKVYFRAKG